jgi:hypothetical protein
MQTRTTTYCILTPERRLSEFFSTAFGRLGRGENERIRSPAVPYWSLFPPSIAMSFFLFHFLIRLPLVSSPKTVPLPPIFRKSDNILVVR